MPDIVKVREILLYSEKVAVADVKNFFNVILKSRLPLFGFIDFTDIFSLNVVNLIIKKNLNTIRFFARDKKSLGDLSLLVFPYKISEPLEIEKARGSIFPIPKFYFLPGSQNFLDFSVKENLLEINLRIVKILGKFIGLGSAIDEGGRKSILISTTPERFMQVDMEQNPAVFIDILDPIPKRMSVTSNYPVFEETGITVGVDNFDVFQHTLFVGASGTGKSKGLYSLIKAIEAKYGDSVKMLLIDPHGEFIKCFSEYNVVNLIDNYIEPLDVGGVKTPQMTQLISQLLSSAIGQENKYSERVLFYATHLLSAIDRMSLKNISLLLTDSSKRAEFISETDNDEVKRFFDEEFNDIYIHHFNDAVLPILNFVGEYELYLGGEKKHEDLLDLIRNNRITIVSFNPNFFGKRMINFLAGAIINQMYILAITEKLSQPTILIVDEFQRVETKVVRDILSETRKFNLYAYISMQYLGQLSKEVSDSVISNIRNIVSFKANRQDATMLSSIMEIKIEESFKKARSQTELEESKKEMFVRLHQRECIVRLFDGKKYILPMKLKVVDVNRWGYKEVKPPEPKAHPSLVKGGAKPAAADEQDMSGVEQADQENKSSEEPQSQEPLGVQSQQQPADWSSFKMDERMGAPKEEEDEPSEDEGKGQERGEEEAESETASEEPEDGKDAFKEVPEEPSSGEEEGKEPSDGEDQPPSGHLSVLEQLRRAREELKAAKKKKEAPPEKKREELEEGAEPSPGHEEDERRYDMPKKRKRIVEDEDLVDQAHEVAAKESELILDEAPSPSEEEPSEFEQLPEERPVSVVKSFSKKPAAKAKPASKGKAAKGKPVAKAPGKFSRRK